MNTNIDFLNGSLNVYDDLTITGPYQFIYSSNYTSTINVNSHLNLENNAELTIGKNNRTTIEQLAFADNSSQLNLNNATINLTGYGMDFKRGTMNIYEGSEINIDTNIDIKNTFSCGDGIQSGNDPNIIIQGGGASLAINNGLFVLNPAISTTMIQFYGQGQLELESTCSFELKKTTTFYNGWILNGPNVTLDLSRNNNLICNDTRFTLLDHSLDYYLTGTRHLNLQDLILDSNDQLIINPGTLARTITINKGNNLITGPGNFDGSLVFINFNSSATWDVIGTIGTGNINLKGGRIRLISDANLQSNYTFVSTGSVDLSDTTFNLPPKSTTWAGNIYWIGNGGKITLNNNVTLSGIWTLSGNLAIDGGGYRLDLDNSGTIILERGAQVSFQNVTLNNLSTKNRFICKDSLGQITLQNATLLMNADTLFNIGSIFITSVNDIGIVQGLDNTFTFSYTSLQTSTIDALSVLRIDHGARFSIGRRNSSITNIHRQPLIFTEPLTSQLILNAGTLHITSSGMILTNGNLEIDDTSSLEVENTVYPYGLILGDGILADDFKLEIESGNELKQKSGKLFYNNYSDNRIVFDSPSSVINITPHQGLTAKTNLTLANGSLYASDTIPFATLGSANFVQSNMTRNITSPYAVTLASVHGVGATFQLWDGDSYYILQGNSIKNVLAVGASAFGGAASFEGTLSLNNNAVTLQSSLSTPFFNNVILNDGTIVFSDDAFFAADKKLTGSGKVQFNGTKVSFGPMDTSQTSTIYWQGLTSGGINLGAKTGLSSTWQFGGNMVINGNGNILDLSDGGILQIRPGATLTLDDISVKGLGQNFGSINFMDNTGTLRLSNSYLELDNNLSTTIGGIYVNGPTTVGLKNYNWTLSQNASMTVDNASSIIKKVL